MRKGETRTQQDTESGFITVKAACVSEVLACKNSDVISKQAFYVYDRTVKWSNDLEMKSSRNEKVKIFRECTRASSPIPCVVFFFFLPDCVHLL